MPGGSPSRGRHGSAAQSRTVQSARPASCPQTRLHTPKPASASGTETAAFTAAWPSSGTIRARKRSSRWSSASCVLPSALIGKLHASARRIGSPSGLRKNAAIAGASSVIAVNQTPPITTLIQKVTRAASSRRSGQ